MIFSLISAVTFFLLRLPSLFEPYWYGDEGIYLTLGAAINRGLTLYSQIHDNKPPTLYYLAALGQTVFGFRLLLLLVMIPTIYIFYLLTKKFLTGSFAKISTFIFLVFTSIPFIEGNIANAEIFMLLPTILGIYLFLYHQKYLLSGLLLGLAFTVKVPVAVEFGLLFLWLFLFTKTSRFKNMFVFGLSFVSPIILYLLYFTLKGAFDQFLFSALLQNFGYLSSWQTGSHSGAASSGGLISRVIILVATWVILYLAFIKKYISKNTLFLLAWLAATIFGVLLSTRPYPHYLIQLLPPLCLLLGNLPQKPLNLIPFLIVVLIIIKYQFYFYPVLSYYRNFYFQGNQMTYFGNRVPDIYKIAAYIKANTSPSDRIFIWGDEPYIYPLSERLPATKYTVAYHILDFNGYDLTMNQLKAHFPKFIIYLPMDNRPFLALDEFITKYYYPTDSINGAIIFQRR